MSWAITAMVAATALTAYNTKETARKQDNAVSQGILARMQSTRDASAAMQKTLAGLRDSNAQPAVDQAKAGYLAALSHNPAMGTQPAQVGALSDAYRQAAGAAANDSSALAGKTAGLMAITDAPGIQRQGEANQIGQLQGVLAGIGSKANDQTNLAQLKARGITRNPWIDLASAAMSGYAKGAGTSAGGGNTVNSDYTGMAGGQFNNGGTQYLTGQPVLGTGDGFSGFSQSYANNANKLYNVGG